MTIKARNRFILLFLAFFCVPFFTFTHWYPFMRFGMFANPQKIEIQKRYILKIDHTVQDPLTALNLQDDVFQYWCSYYLSKGQGEVLIHRLKGLSRIKTEQIEVVHE